MSAKVEGTCYCLEKTLVCALVYLFDEIATAVKCICIE